jgi:hypothetical protein
MDSEQFKTIDMSLFCDHNGGMDTFKDQVRQVAEEAPEEHFFVEFGSYRGGSALTLLDVIRQTKPERWLLTVDPYGAKPFLVGKELRPEFVYSEDIYRDMTYNLSGFSSAYNLNHAHYRVTSNDFMTIFDSMKFWYKGSVMEPKIACIYIDGEHTGEQVDKEITWAKKHMEKGGLIILDDVTLILGEYPEVLDTVRHGFQDNFRCFRKI